MSTENNEVIKTVENVDELFETIVVNGETFTSSKYVAPQKTEKPTVSTATTDTSKEDDELLGRVTRAVQNVSAVELNDVNYPIKDENTYDKNTIDSKLEEAGKVKTVDYIAPDDNGNIALGVTLIKDLIPPQASEINKLADKNFVNSSIQTNTANFRGNWATWEAVPTEASEYPSDYAGNTTPTENDYMVVQNASSYGQAYEGTWRFKYSGNWAEVGKNGWYHEYQVNETPLTAEQLATLNSGLTATSYGGTSAKATSVVDYGDTNKSIQIGYAGSGLTTVTHLAGYGSGGTTIKNISLSNVKKAMYIPATKVYGSMSGNTKYVTITFNDTYGGILVTTGYISNLWFDSNKGTPYAFSESTAYGVTGYAWSSDGKTLYLKLSGYRPITVTIPSFYADDGRVTFGNASATAPSGVTFLTSVRTIASNAVSYNTQTLTDAQKAQARSNIGAGTSSFSGSYNDLSNKPTIPTSLPIKSQGINGWTTETDTVANWASKGSVVWWIDDLNQIKDQPARYGIILNLKVKADEVRQLWFTQTGGGIYDRSGNCDGWAGTWRRLAFSSEIPSISGCATTTDSRNAYRATHIPTSQPDSNVGAIWIS